MEENKQTVHSTASTDAGKASNHSAQTTAEIGGYVKGSSSTDIPWSDRVSDIPWCELHDHDINDLVRHLWISEETPITKPYPNPEGPYAPNIKGPFIPNQPNYPHNPGQLNYGWICPKCGSVFSPNTKECPYCRTQQRTIEVTFSTPQDVHWHSNSTVQAQKIENQGVLQMTETKTSASFKMPDDVTSTKLNS